MEDSDSWVGNLVALAAVVPVSRGHEGMTTTFSAKLQQFLAGLNKKISRLARSGIVISPPVGIFVRMKPLRAFGRFLRGSIRTTAVTMLFAVMAVGALRVLPPAYTPIMFLRVYEGLLEGRLVGVERSWIPYEQVSPNFFRAIVGAEDARFMRHHGIDWRAMEDAMRYNRAHRGRKVRGASTITMQTAKNVFLWHGRTYVRKGLEAWFTYAIEHLWGKKRILEVYANVVEMGDGIYGIEAAARTYFGKSATELTRREAALIAAVLPNPRRWSPASPTPYIKRRASWIMGRMGGVAIPKDTPVF